MRRAIELGWQGRFGAHPNPMVGAVVVRDGVIVGEGFHETFGQAHAEPIALEQAGEAARGADLYVTLEPCRHQGKTPPCTQAIIKAGIGRVIIGIMDPDSSLSGGGAKDLEEAGIVVETGLLAGQCRQLCRTFLHRVETGKPWVTLKAAMSLDGKVATHTGSSRWITDAVSRIRVHEKRAEVDAVLTGLGTVVADDPMLNVRIEGKNFRSPCRMVLDPEAQTPIKSKMVQTAREQRTVLLVSERIPEEVSRDFEEQGVEVLRLAYGRHGFEWGALLQWCGQQGMNEVMIEAGPYLAGSAFDAGAINGVMFFIAPKLIGGMKSPGVLGGLGVETVGRAAELVNWKISHYGPDLLVEAEVGYS
jgi:diaminohydroxyphosphoribosylaminopyrimidine deaminase / 5-amino-6-(5-phosphoribosylamino)uracil reductase